MLIHVYGMCTKMHLVPSLGCLPSVCRCEDVAVGKGERDVNIRCIIYRFSSMSMLCAHFPVTFQMFRKKKQQNNVMERKTFSKAQ